MDSLTVSTALINATSENTLTPAMATVLYVVSDHVDSLRLKAVPVEGLWIRMPSARLRGTGGRNDNIWLRKCLERLQTIRMGGEYRGDPWGAVMISQFRITEGGTVCEILLPPAAVEVLCAPETFAKIEAHAAYKLQGASRRLYVALADKKRMAQDHWTFPLDELRGVLGAKNKKSYQRWNNFKHWVLEPAVEAINDFGTVKIRMTPEKTGKSIDRVRFEWSWKSLDEIRVTDEENERHETARHRTSDGTAPPLTLSEPAMILHGQIAEAKWNSWFAQCMFSDDSNHNVTVSAPSTFVAEYIRSNFASEIGHTVERLGLKTLKIVADENNLIEP